MTVTNIKLCTLIPGEQAVIAGILPETADRRRLRELGMTDGEQVECVLKRKNISAYLVKGTLIALRDEDSGRIYARMQACTYPESKRRHSSWL